MSNHDRFCGDAISIEPAVTTGCLFHLPYGFPAMFDAPDGRVFGEVISFSNVEEKIQRMDYLEGYRPEGNSHYLRIHKTATLISLNRDVTVWIYVYPAERIKEVQRAGRLVTNGDWRDYLCKNAL